jgi:hypothetical protein
MAESNRQGQSFLLSLTQVGAGERKVYDIDTENTFDLDTSGGQIYS